MNTERTRQSFYEREFKAGKAACQANHGALADRWQEIGRQGCEATHGEIKRQGNIRSALWITRHADEARARGRREGAVLGLGVAFGLAVVAGALGRRWGE